MLFLRSSGSQRHVELAGKLIFSAMGDGSAGGCHNQAAGRTNEQIGAAILLVIETGMALLVLDWA
jgi:hypothetical protein